MIKSMLKSELAKLAGVSESTFKRWLHRHDAELLVLGVTPRTKLIPPNAVRWICEQYGIDL